MAVQGTETPPRSSTQGADKKGNKSFVKKNKLLVGAGAVGGIVLLMAHKGKGLSGEAGELANQQAIENERAAQEAGSIVPAATPPAREGAGEGGEGGVSLPGSPGSPSTNQGASENSAVAAALDRNTAAVEGLASRTEAQDAGTTEVKASSAPKAKTKKPVKKSTSKKHNHSGVTVHGRHFPGAHGHTKGKTHRDHKGKTHTVVHVHSGGHSTTHISHDNGKSWTDHPAGHTPPKRTTRARSHPSHHSHGREIPLLHKGAPLPGGGSGGYVVRPAKKAPAKKAPVKKYKRYRA